MPRINRYRTIIPNITTSKGTTSPLSYKHGVDKQSDNDDVKITSLVEAIDTRMVKIGRYRTRRGLDRLSVPVGETLAASVTSTAGAMNQTVNKVQYQAQLVSIAATGFITKVEFKIGHVQPRGTLLVEIRENNGGEIGEIIAISSYRANDVTLTAGYLPAHFLPTKKVINGDSVWVVIRGQSKYTGEYFVTSTTSATTAKFSFNGGAAWTAANYALNVKVYTSPENPVKGLIRVNRPNKLNSTFFAAGTAIYKVDEATGVTTAIKTGLNELAQNYEFEVVQDVLRFSNGYEQPYMYDFTSVTQDDNCPMLPELLIEHVGLLFVARTDDSKIAWSKFGEYAEWKSTDFAYMLAPKTPFTTSAFAKLNGILYVFSEKNKYQLLGEDNQSFTASEATSQRGTFTQRSVIYDDNSIYHADHDGIWQFNGTDERELSESFSEEYRSISNKKDIVLEKWNNRLYVFFTSPNAAKNDSCYVINLSLGVLESTDINTPISRAYARKDRTNLFLQASNAIAAVYTAEQQTNDYHNVGAPLNFELKTAYSHFDTPAQYKRVTFWRPEFVSTSGEYDVECGYSKEFEAHATWQQLPLSGSGPRFDSGITYGSGARYATDANIQATTIMIGGTFRRLQRRFRHIAAREPVEFDSEVLKVETQRLR